MSLLGVSGPIWPDCDAHQRESRRSRLVIDANVAHLMVGGRMGGGRTGRHWRRAPELLRANRRAAIGFMNVNRVSIHFPVA